MGFRVEGVKEASLTSDVFVACLLQHSCRRLAGLSPSACSEGVRKLRKPPNVEPASRSRAAFQGGRGGQGGRREGAR